MLEPLNTQERMQMTANLDQETALIGEFLECREYCFVLLDVVNGLVKSTSKVMNQPEATPESEVTMKANIVDLMNVLRMSQAYLCQHILNQEG